MAKKKSEPETQPESEETVAQEEGQQEKPRTIIVSMTDAGNALTTKVKTTTELYMESSE